MIDYQQLCAALQAGTVPAGANEKLYRKISGDYAHLVNPKVARLYDVRDCVYDDLSYRVYAFSVKDESIDEYTLKAIRREVTEELEVGDVRYNAASGGTRLMSFDAATGKYTCAPDDIDAVMALSDTFDGVVLFTVAEDRGKEERLDCRYVAYGHWDGGGGMLQRGWKGEAVIPIQSRAIGNPVDAKRDFAGVADASCDASQPGDSPIVEKYKEIMHWVTVAAIVGGAIWYFFLR